MYGRILVPTDGSPCSEHAVGEAARFAHVLGAEVTVLCVVDVFARVRDGLVNAAVVVEEARREATRAVAHAEEVFAELGPPCSARSWKAIRTRRSFAARASSTSS